MLLHHTDVIASSSPWGPATWEDLQINHPSYPYPMPIEYQDYPYETLPGSIGFIKPDVSAPGNGTTSTVNGTGYGSFQWNFWCYTTRWRNICITSYLQILILLRRGQYDSSNNCSRKRRSGKR